MKTWNTTPPDYEFYDDGSDEEALPEDRITVVADDPSQTSLDSDSPSLEPLDNTDGLLETSALKTEFRSSPLKTACSTDDMETEAVSDSPSPSQTLPPGNLGTVPKKRPAQTRDSAWMWAYIRKDIFTRKVKDALGREQLVTDVNNRCIIRLPHGGECTWGVLDSKRESSTAAFYHHLTAVHGLPPSGKRKKVHHNTTSSRFLTNENLQERFDRVIAEFFLDFKLPFQKIERDSFRNMIATFSGQPLPMRTRKTVWKRLLDNALSNQVKLKDELAKTCQSIALSLDVCSSPNRVPFLGIIGHWLTEDFEYMERTLAFRELGATHSGEDLAAEVEQTLVEFDIESKLIAITGDNASNNLKMVDELHARLVQKGKAHPLFEGRNSFVRCFAHILNLVVKHIMSALDSVPCVDNDFPMELRAKLVGLDVSNPAPRISAGGPNAISSLRHVVMWISETTERRRKWKETCQKMSAPDKFIKYDISTHWNSTYRLLQDAIEVSS